MARISTYPIDSIVSLQDNVIGTNQSPGHVNETVLFPVSGLAALITEGYAQIHDVEVNYGQDIPVSGVLPAIYLPSIAPSLPDGSAGAIIRGSVPSLQFTHPFNTMNVVVSVFENTTDFNANGFVQTGFRDVSNDLDISIIDNDTVLVDFGLPRPITGRVIIIG